MAKIQIKSEKLAPFGGIFQFKVVPMFRQQVARVFLRFQFKIKVVPYSTRHILLRLRPQVQGLSFRQESKFLPDFFSLTRRQFLFSRDYFCLSYKKVFVTKFVTHIRKFVTHITKFVIHVTKFVTNFFCADNETFQAQKKNLTGDNGNQHINCLFRKQHKMVNLFQEIV